MKTLHISKFSIFMISIVVFALGVYTVLVYTTQNDTTQSERIYLHPDFTYGDTTPFLVKVSDMKPNSVGYFMYPSSYNFSESENAYQRFLLIRLPSWMGGDKNDISSYRAYSMLDVESHCLIKYWPQEERQRIEDPCHVEMYRVIDGASYLFGIKFVSKPIENALPKLDLGVDNEGYIYVKRPTWTVDKNGIVGEGRNLSKDEIFESSKILLQDYENSTHFGIHVPLELDDDSFLIDVIQNKDGAQFRYTKTSIASYTPIITLNYCNCTKPLKEMPRTEHEMTFFSAWRLGNTTIYASPNYIEDSIPKNYQFTFYENGYKLQFDSQKSFTDGMQTTLDVFFNGAKLSDIVQVPYE